MPATVKLKVESRKITGRKTKQLRRQGLLPANIYGKDVKSLAVQVSLKDFTQVYGQVGETSVVELTVAKAAKPRPVLIHNVQLHPVTDDFLHADFRQIDLTKKLTVAIPIEISGEAPAATKGGVLIQLLDEIEVEALPTDLPDKFIVDVSNLETIGQGISLKDIKVDTAKVKLITDNPDELVVKIEEPAKEEEKAPEAPPVEAEAAPEAEAVAKPAKPEEPAKEKEKKPAAQPQTGQPMADKAEK